jgi:integrase
MRAFLHELSEAGEPGEGDTTMSVLFRRWLENLADSKAKSTVETYRTVIGTHLEPAFGRRKLRDVTPYSLDQYYAARQKAGMGPRTIRQHHAILSSAFTQAMRWEWIDRNPARLASPPPIPRQKRIIPEVEQVHKLLDAAGGDVELATAIFLAAVTGARRGELCGLRWCDIDWGEGTLRIERQRVPLEGGEATVPLKHGDGRTVAVGPVGLAVLRWYRGLTEERADLLEVAVPPDGWLLSKDCGRSPLRSKGLGEAITDLGRRAGVPVTTHAFRRFAATQMVGTGVDVRTAAGRLGHTPDMLLRVYAGFMPSRDRLAAEGLEALVLPPDAKRPRRFGTGEGVRKGGELSEGDATG